jgi:hypothetical protein
MVSLRATVTHLHNRKQFSYIQQCREQNSKYYNSSLHHNCLSYNILSIFNHAISQLLKTNFNIILFVTLNELLDNGKAILTGRGGPYGFETLMLPLFVDNRLTSCGQVVSLTLRPPLIPRYIPGTHFC